MLCSFIKLNWGATYNYFTFHSLFSHAWSCHMTRGLRHCQSICFIHTHTRPCIHVYRLFKISHRTLGILSSSTWMSLMPMPFVTTSDDEISWVLEWQSRWSDTCVLQLTHTHTREVWIRDTHQWCRGPWTQGEVLLNSWLLCIFSTWASLSYAVFTVVP